jgi:muconolactone delta-isomerase
VFGHDWRVVPPAAWLTLLGEREVGASSAPSAAAKSAEQIVVLSQGNFATAVRDALRDFVRPDLLRGNPLTRSRLVLDAVHDSVPADRAAALQARIKAAADALQASPRDLKLYRALHHTYFQPAPTQERAAELLDLPFSTYRRHLMAGIAQLTEALWQREVGGA